MLNKNRLLLCFSALSFSSVFADDYISLNNYIQNPFNGLPSGGGTQTIVESQIASDNFWKKWFSDGTYNVQGAATYTGINKTPNFGYGANIFAQTGSAAGISVGGNLAIANPLFANFMNPNNYAPPNNQFLPADRVFYPNELFAEYKYPSVFQADIGWLYINTPWLTSYFPIGLVQPTFQGVLLNYQLTHELLFTGLAINGYMPISNNGFTGETLYNEQYDFGTRTPNIAGSASTGSFALGVQYGMDQAWKSELWAYQFNDYAAMLYGDSKYTLTITPKLNFVFAGQIGTEGANGADALNQAGYGSPQSNLVGLQFAVNYDWFGFAASYNSVFDFNNANAYAGGGLVSPYTYQLATDPLYTTATLAGLVEKSAGSAFKLAPSFNFFNNSFTISPSYAAYYTSPYPDSDEWDLNLSYSLPSVKGLNFSGYIAYLQQAQSAGGNVSFFQVFVSYLY